VTKLEDLKNAGAATLELDVTSPLEKLHQAAKEAVSIYGRVHVLVNNAGKFRSSMGAGY
jgi:NAD(P)-dependent dehydrogenase (short-subunit alcohol dehydrogenase family)